MAAATWLGARWAAPVPLWCGPLVALAGVRTRGRLLALACGLLLVGSALGARSIDGLTPVERSPHDGEVTLVGDPRWFGPSLRVDVRIDGGRRVEAWARGAAAAALSPRMAGERIELSGRLGPPPDDAPWLVTRHVVGRLSVTEVGEWRRGDLPSRAANGLRRTLIDGAGTMDPDRRSLYLGLLLGDRSDEDPLVADDFAGSGLTHLLAVSGSNVAFVMSLLGPLLMRMRLGRRLVAGLAVLAFFALVTRFEPSVLRATTMAGLGAVAVTFGWESESRRLLAGAVIVLLLVDPLLARSAGFQLSVAASAGILVWSRSLASAIRGPRLVVEPLAVTIAAQAAVAPLLIPLFGGLPVASLPANLLAGPAAGPVVVWGLPAGLVAGVVGAPADGLLHLPTELFVSWIGAVAAHGATWPLGELGLGHLLVAWLGVAAIWFGRQAQWWRRVGALVVVAAVLHPAAAMRVGPPTMADLGPAAQLHRHDDAVVVELDVGVRPATVIEGLRRAGVRRVDVVVAHHGGRDVAEVVALLAERAPPRLVLAPSGHRVPGGSVPVPGQTVRVGGFAIAVEGVDPRLTARVSMPP
ncbi:MAG: ComEC/Rec2 family competence protein [Acidimicrobiia bacterium]|nr:ComEC/Rec2 family competence protein [Acidimicrobiia bacterium]